MASIVNDPNGRRRVQFEGVDGKRRTLRLGKVSAKDAGAVLLHVERLAMAARHGTSAPVDTQQWASLIGETLHAKIAAVGLVPPRATAEPAKALNVDDLFAAYVARRTDLKAGTILVFGQARNHVGRFFGPTRPADTITVGEAKDFRRDMAARYSEAYVGKMIRQARQVWRDAIDRKHLADNPFSTVKLGSSKNPTRQRFIDRPTIDKIIDHAADPQWKLLIALARYAGLRMPSEPLRLTWADVNFAEGKMIVHASKTEHHNDKGIRVVPIFPEIAPLLQQAYDLAEPGEEHVITRYRQKNGNLRTQFQRIIKAAGFAPWPRLFHNLRASCQTELAERFPGHVVCQWIGNSEAIAKAHYLQVTDAHFAAASGNAKGEKVSPNPTLQTAATSGRAAQPATAAAETLGNIEKPRETGAIGWAMRDSNPRLPPCKGGTLAAELMARGLCPRLCGGRS